MLSGFELYPRWVPLFDHRCDQKTQRTIAKYNIVETCGSHNLTYSSQKTSENQETPKAEPFEIQTCRNKSVSHRVHDRKK